MRAEISDGDSDVISGDTMREAVEECAKEAEALSDGGRLDELGGDEVDEEGVGVWEADGVADGNVTVWRLGLTLCAEDSWADEPTDDSAEPVTVVAVMALDEKGAVRDWGRLCRQLPALVGRAAAVMDRAAADGRPAAVGEAAVVGENRWGDRPEKAPLSSTSLPRCSSLPIGV